MGFSIVANWVWPTEWNIPGLLLPPPCLRSWVLQHRPRHLGVKYIQCVQSHGCHLPNTQRVRVCVCQCACLCAMGKGEEEVQVRHCLPGCGWISVRCAGGINVRAHTHTPRHSRTHTQWDVCTARGVCILRGDYMDENRGVFSTDLESDWWDKETIEGGWSQSKQRAHTRTQVRWIRNLMLCGPARTRAHGRTQLLSTLWCFKSRELLCDAVEVMKVEKRTDHLGCICVSSIIN